MLPLRRLSIRACNIILSAPPSTTLNPNRLSYPTTFATPSSDRTDSRRLDTRATTYRKRASTPPVPTTKSNLTHYRHIAKLTNSATIPIHSSSHVSFSKERKKEIHHPSTDAIGRLHCTKNTKQEKTRNIVVFYIFTNSLRERFLPCVSVIFDVLYYSVSFDVKLSMCCDNFPNPFLLCLLL